MPLVQVPYGRLHAQCTQGAHAADAQQYALGNLTIKAGNPFIPTSVAAQMAALKITSLSIGTMNGDLPPFGSYDARTVNRYVVGASGKLDAFDQTWKWVTYMGSTACQTTAGKTATFLPSIASALQSTVDYQKTQGVDIQSFVDAAKNNELYPAPPMANGQELADTIQPEFEAFFTGEKGDSIFQTMQTQSQQILTKK